MAFKSKYDKKKDIFYSNPGSPMTDDYSYVYDDNGYKHLEISGHTNLQAKIQAEKDYCNIALLVERFEAGDDNAFDRVKGFYADVTEFPKTYMEMVERVEDSRKYFNALDPSIKKLFGNNPDEFWAMYGTAEFAERIGKFESDKIMNDIESEEKSE